MKHILTFFGLFLLIFVTSCKKNRTCGCTLDYTGADTSWTSTRDIIIEESSKKGATTACSLEERTSTILTETLVVQDCKLKE